MQLMINCRYFPVSPKRLGDRCCLGDCMLRYPDQHLVYWSLQSNDAI